MVLNNNGKKTTHADPHHLQVLGERTWISILENILWLRGRLITYTSASNQQICVIWSP